MNLLNELLKSENVQDLVQIVGLIRFSYPSESGAGGYRARYADRDEQLATLFAPARMESRLKLFQQVCLHTLTRQSHTNFTIGLLVGEDMPQVYLARLQSLISDQPLFRIIVLPIMPYKAAVAAAFGQLFDHGKPFHLSFRLDDDDAVSIDFIERLNSYLPQMIMTTFGMDPVCIAFTSGLTVTTNEDGAREVIASTMFAPLGVGVGVLAPSTWSGNVFSVIHPRLHFKMRTIFDPTETVMLRVFHGGNDSAGKVGGLKRERDASEIDSILRARFALDLETVLAW